MKKYKEIITEQSFSTGGTSKIASSSAGKTVSSGTLTDFGAGNQTLSGFSATQAQAPLSPSYSSATRKGNAITQYKQGNVKAQKNYFTTNVVGKKQPFRADDDDERDFHVDNAGNDDTHDDDNTDDDDDDEDDDDDKDDEDDDE